MLSEAVLILTGFNNIPHTGPLVTRLSADLGEWALDSACHNGTPPAALHTN